MDCPPWFEETPSWLRRRTGASAEKNRVDNRMLQLHREIVHFCLLASPTPQEHATRTAAIQRVAEVVRSLWPRSEIKVFGSFATGLYLPTSDIDVVILNSGFGTPQSRLSALAKQLQGANVARKVEVIGRARVPIAKFEERWSGVEFDVRLDSQKELQAVEEVREAMEERREMEPLYKVLKMWFKVKGLNEVYHKGGVGSYTLYVMLRKHLQMHSAKGNDNLGLLLAGFFELYGRCLKVREYGISCRDGGKFFRKVDKGWIDPWKPYLLAAEDPLDPTNDIGKNSFNFPHIQASFRQTLQLLTSDDACPALPRILGPRLGLQPSGS